MNNAMEILWGFFNTQIFSMLHMSLRLFWGTMFMWKPRAFNMGTAVFHCLRVFRIWFHYNMYNFDIIVFVLHIAIPEIIV